MSLNLFVLNNKKKIRVIILLIAIFLGFVISSHFRWSGDFYQYWIAGKALNSLSITSIYSSQESQNIGHFFSNQAVSSSSLNFKLASNFWQRPEFTQTPFFYSFYFYLSKLDYDICRAAILLISILVYGLAIFWLSDQYEGPLGFKMILEVMLMTLYYPFLMDIRYGNINSIHFGALIFLLRYMEKIQMRNEFFLSGLFIALLFLVKPLFYPVFLFIFLSLFIKGHRKNILFLLFGIFSGILVAFFVPKILLGNSATWSDWYRNLSEISGKNKYINRSFLYFVFHLTNPLIFHFLELFFTMVTFIFLWSYRSFFCFHEKKLNLIYACYGIACHFLFFSLIHRHNFIFLIPLYFVCLGQIIHLNEKYKRVNFSFWLLSFVFVSFHPLFFAFGIISDERHSILYFFAVIILTLQISFIKKKEPTQIL